MLMKLTLGVPQVHSKTNRHFLSVAIEQTVLGISPVETFVVVVVEVGAELGFHC